MFNLEKGAQAKIPFGLLIIMLIAAVFLFGIIACNLFSIQAGVCKSVTGFFEWLVKR